MSTFSESNTERTFIFQKRKPDSSLDPGVSYIVDGFHPVPRIGETVGFIDERTGMNISGHVESVGHQFIWKHDTTTNTTKLVHGIQIILK